MALLAEIQRVFENTYDRSVGVDLESCLVGRTRYAELAVQSGGSHPEMSEWARFFYYLEGDDLRLALFYAREVIETLEVRDPRRGLGESNILPFLVFTEECSHAVHTSFAFGESGPDRIHHRNFLVELEVLARIDAYLLLRHFVNGMVPRFRPVDRAWVRHQAVTRWDRSYADPRLEVRYRDAARLAGRFVDHLESMSTERRLPELRAFRSLSLTAMGARVEGLD